MGWAADGVEREAFPAKIFEIHFVELEKIAQQNFFLSSRLSWFFRKNRELITSETCFFDSDSLPAETPSGNSSEPKKLVFWVMSL